MRTASRLSSGVAMRKAMAAVGGTPETTIERYRGTTPHEQTGRGRPKAMPRPAWESREPRPIQSTVPWGSRA